MITGLCRCLKNFQIGDRYIYVTRLCPKAMRLRKLSDSSGPRYFGVASMIVTGVRASHEEASNHANTWLPRQKRHILRDSRTLADQLRPWPEKAASFIQRQVVAGHPRHTKSH